MCDVLGNNGDWAKRGIKDHVEEEVPPAYYYDNL